MIRPEALAVGDRRTHGKPATVLWREFFGHYQRLGLALADGTELIAQAGVDRYYRRGRPQVSVSLALPALAYDNESERALTQNAIQL